MDELNIEQSIAYEKIVYNNKNIFLTGPGGVGKCLAKNTGILMYDGSMKKVQDINLNDTVMGDDSTPRNILGITRGISDLYKITHLDGSGHYICNDAHNLCLFYVEKNKCYGGIMSAAELYKLSNKKRGCFMGYRAIIKCSIKCAGTYEMRCEALKSIIKKYQTKYKKGVIKIYGLPHELIDDVIYLGKSIGINVLIFKNYVKIKMGPLLSRISIDYIGRGEYYGFMTDRNHKFVLDNFIITHNSYLVRKIYSDLSMVKNVGLTSLTGVSALILGGKTLHSFLGIGLGTDTYKKLYKFIRLNNKIHDRWINLDVLIIDEISMLSIELFEKIEKLARELRCCERPFGGIQLLLVGDFLQLPTVGNLHFCFESAMWDICIDETILLRQIMRQKDATFTRILNKIRMGDIDDECKEIIGSREIKYISDSGLIPTMLYATNAKVNATNEKYYSLLDGPEYTYSIKYKWYRAVRQRESYINAVKMEHDLKLKIGAQVMYLINSGELVNGSRGVVKEFIENYPVVLFNCGRRELIRPATLDIKENDNVVLSYTQLPLKLAWSSTCHKLQGATVSLIRIDFGQFFEYGQFYTALSRCESLDGLYIRNLDWAKCYPHPRAIEFYKKLK